MKVLKIKALKVTCATILKLASCKEIDHGPVQDGEIMKVKEVPLYVMMLKYCYLGHHIYTF